MVNGNLPKLKKLNGQEGDKVFQTEADVASGRNIKMHNIKNNILNNYLIKKKNKSGASLDIKLIYYNGKSYIGFNHSLRNVILINIFINFIICIFILIIYIFTNFFSTFIFSLLINISSFFSFLFNFCKLLPL